jgi:hypothetical protein
MPVSTVNAEMLTRRLERDPFVFVETRDMQDMVASIVHEYCHCHEAIYTDNVEDMPRIMVQSLQNPTKLYVVYVRDWQRFSGNEIMLHFNMLFEKDLERYGPNAWCAPEYRHQSLCILPSGQTVDGSDMYKNVKLVFSGTRDPLNDPCLRSRLMSYTCVM